MRRLFVGWFPDAATDARIDVLVELLQSRLTDPAYRWQGARHRHMTLRFLGDTDEERSDALATGLAGLASGSTAPGGRIAGWQYWPSVRAPRVLIARIESGGALERLGDGVESVAVGAGFAPEHRRFRAHLTLARVGRLRVPPRPFVEAPPRIDVRVHELALVASELRPEGSHYSIVQRWPLAGLARK